jgi:hypothetical protein
MYLILWESDPAMYPSDPNERMKILMSHIEMIKKDVDSGEAKMWGVSVGGGSGFVVTEDNPKQSFAKSMVYSPYAKFDIRPMLTIDEMMDVIKEMQK